MKLRAIKDDKHFKNKQLPLNNNGNNFNEMFNDVNYKKPINKLQDAGWKNICLKYYDVYIIGHGYGVYQYPQFNDQK